MHVTIIALAGPSGAGKTELARGLLEAQPEVTTKWAQVTTRPRRGPEDDYVFLTRDQYATLRESLTCRTSFGGNRYGTFPEVSAPGSVVVTVVDIRGIEDLRRDVETHNRLVDELGAGKFGEARVELGTFLLRYDVSRESVEARARTSRGEQFIIDELHGLDQLGGWDGVIDTTTSWPDAAAFFSEHVSPVMGRAGPPGQESVLREQAIAWLMGASSHVPSMPRARLEQFVAALPSYLPEEEREPEAVADAVTGEDATPEKLPAPPAPEVSLEAAVASQGFEDWLMDYESGIRGMATPEALDMTLASYLRSSGLSRDSVDVVVSELADQEAVRFSFAQGGFAVNYLWSRRLRRFE